MTSDITLSDAEHTARKVHQCDHCGKEIAPGTRYRRTRAIWDGTPDTFRAHVECHACAIALHDLHDLRWDEGICLCLDVEEDDHEWMRAEFPIVADRLEPAQ